MKTYLTPIIGNALEKIGIKGDFSLGFAMPKIKEHGDLSTPIAMTLAKEFKKNPRQVAQEILDNLDYDPTILTKIEIAGAGFINFTFASDFYARRLADMLEKGEDFGRSDKGRGLRVNVEYVSANPTGLLHLGHGRNAAIGDTVANILAWSGYDVTREYYFNNAGNQMNNLGKSVFARYRQQCGEPDFPFPENGYHGEYISEIASAILADKGDSLKDETPENLTFCMKSAEKWCFEKIDETLKRMGIHQDVQFNEDTLYSDGKVKATVEALREKGFVYEQDGATWLAVSKVGLEKDRVIIKSTGEATYRLPDIAYHADKISRGFDLIVDVFGADHIATIPDVMAAVGMLGYDQSKIKVLIYQFVTLMENGEQVKMSKRSGKSYTLDELIEDVGADVARFFFIMRGINTHLEFDLGLAREQSEKNPVFYLQYAHARIASILRNAAERGVMVSEKTDLSVLSHPDEITLIKEILRFPEVVLRTAETLEPQTIVEYLREVASGFHKFYHECRILGEAESLQNARLRLAEATKIVMKNGLTILGISAPEKM